MASTEDTDVNVGTNVGSSPPKVVFHGDLAEFRDQHRCESCTARNKRCILQRGEESCMFCSDADRPCVYERIIQLQGSALRSHWDALVALRSLFDVRYTNDLRSRDVTLDPNLSLMTDDMERRSDIPLLDGELGTRKRLLACQEPRVTTDYGPVKLAVQAPQSRPTSPPTSPHSPIQVIGGKRARGRAGPRKKRSSSHAAKVRVMGACSSCRVRKVKCSHVVLDDFRGHSSNSPPISRSPVARSSTFGEEEPAESASSNLVSLTSTNGKSNEKSAKSPAAENSSEISLARQERRVYCPIPDCGLHFRGEHELTRHHVRVHRDQRAVWVCKDISEDKKALAGCKSCEAGKQYNVDYNAVQHLRRCHVAVKSQPQAAGDPIKTDSTDAKRLVDVPNDSMEELRKWLRKEWIRNEDARGSDDAAKKGPARLITGLAEADWGNELEESFKSYPEHEADWQALPGYSYEPCHPQPILLP